MTRRDDLLLKKTDRYIGEQIRTLRATCGLTQEKLAEKMGISYQQLQKYEHAKNHVTAARLYQIACILHVPVQNFFPQEQLGEYVPVPTRMLRVTRILSSMPAKYHDEIVAICLALENIVSGGSSQPGG